MSLTYNWVLVALTLVGKIKNNWQTAPFLSLWLYAKLCSSCQIGCVMLKSTMFVCKKLPKTNNKTQLVLNTHKTNHIQMWPLVSISPTRILSCHTIYDIYENQALQAIRLKKLAIKPRSYLIINMLIWDYIDIYKINFSSLIYRLHHIQTRMKYFCKGHCIKAESLHVKYVFDLKSSDI